MITLKGKKKRERRERVERVWVLLATLASTTNSSTSSTRVELEVEVVFKLYLLFININNKYLIFNYYTSNVFCNLKGDDAVHEFGTTHGLHFR